MDDTSDMNDGNEVNDVDPVDRLGARYQQARLHRRRMHRRLAEAIAQDTLPARQAALARYRTAVAWEQRCFERYLRAVFAAYAVPAGDSPLVGLATPGCDPVPEVTRPGGAGGCRREPWGTPTGADGADPSEEARAWT
jgi:hypothetical protein